MLFDVPAASRPSDDAAADVHLRRLARRCTVPAAVVGGGRRADGGDGRHARATAVAARPLTLRRRAASLARRCSATPSTSDPVTLRRRQVVPVPAARRRSWRPTGHIWFHPEGAEWRDDFAAAGLASRTLFVHELTHVWQRQCGVNLVVARRPFARYAYLPLVPGKAFAAYGIEQQACIVADAYFIA